MRDGPVNHAVVVAQCDVTHRANGDGVIHDHGTLLNGAKAQDAHVRLADYRQTEEPAENARIGNGKSAFLDLFGLQPLRASALRQIVHGALDAEEVFFVGVLHHRNNQSPVQRHGDSDVDVLMDDHVRAVKRSVHRRKCAQTCHRGFHEKRHKRQFGLVALLEFFFRFGAQDRYFGHVNFIDRIYVRGNMFGGHHVLGDPLPHGAHGLHFIIAEINFFAGHSGFEGHMSLSPGRAWSGRWCRCRRYQDRPRRRN